MTPQEYIGTNPTLEDMRGKWVVMTKALRDDLLARQDTIESRFRVNPIELTDGTWTLSCDVFSELGNGVFQPLFSVLDQSKLSQAEIKPSSEVLDLIPQPEPIE
jgi:hypothetical protein